MGCGGMILRRVREKVPEEDLQLRELLLPVLVIIGVVAAVACGWAVTDFGWASRTVVYAHLITLVLMTAMAVVLCTAATPLRRVMSASSIVMAVVVMLYDHRDAAMLMLRSWPSAVVVLDILLIFETGVRHQQFIIGIFVLYFAVDTAEASQRFGWYELALFDRGRLADEAEVLQCSDPPCAIPPAAVVAQVLPALITVGADFYLTRRFSVGMRQQMGLVQASVSVAESVATLLARYAVAEAGGVLEQEGHRLPPDLLTALRQLLVNLEEYRPFLPGSLLSHSDYNPTHVGPPPPGRDPPSRASICFTDIESSTQLWEYHPQGMYEALQTHNTLMRSLAAQYQGYEVKTIGDAFMLAFQTPDAACGFGLGVQRELAARTWPKDLLRSDLCALVLSDDGQTVWNGLRVRIGIHCGEVRVEQNPVTRRYDYFGSTVNMASRVEAAVGRGGFIGVTSDVIRAVSLVLLRRPFVKELPPRSLKGISGDVVIHIMLPAELAARVEALGQARVDVSQHTKSSDAGQMSVSGTRSTESVSSSRLELTPALLHLGLLVRPMTAAVVWFDLPTDPTGFVADALSAVQIAADRCNGELRSVSTSILVVWNSSSRPCAAGASQCHLFLSSVSTARRAGQLHCGASSSSACSGNVGTSRHRFATVIGGCVDMAVQLAEEAALCSDFALVTDDVADACRAAGCAHRAQLWTVGEEVLVVWEMAPDDCGAASSERWEWLLMERAGTGDDQLDVLLQELVRGRNAQVSGPAAARLQDRAARGAVRQRTVPPAWGRRESGDLPSLPVLALDSLV